MTDANEPTPNLPLLRKCLDWATEQNKLDRADPMREWDQHTWHSTALQRATEWAMENAEVYLSQSEARAIVLADVDFYKCSAAYCIAGYACMVNGDEPDFIPEKARVALGLTQYEADNLFHASNDLLTVRSVMKGIAARAGETL